MKTTGKTPEWIFPFERDSTSNFGWQDQKWSNRPIITMADKAHINGWDLDGSKAQGTHNNANWILNNTQVEGDFFISNSHFKNSDRELVLLKTSGTLNIYNSSFTGSNGTAILVEGKRGFINIHNSYIADNRLGGLIAENGGKIVGRNLLVENNKGFGVGSGGYSPGPGSQVEIFDSVIKNNYFNLYITTERKKKQ